MLQDGPWQEDVFTLPTTMFILERACRHTNLRQLLTKYFIQRRRWFETVSNPIHDLVRVWHRRSEPDDLPTPAAARYCARGQPSPPQPTTSTEVLDKFSWPVNNLKKDSHRKTSRFHPHQRCRFTKWSQWSDEEALINTAGGPSAPHLSHPARAGEAACCSAWCHRCRGMLWLSEGSGGSHHHAAPTQTYGSITSTTQETEESFDSCLKHTLFIFIFYIHLQKVNVRTVHAVIWWCRVLFKCFLIHSISKKYGYASYSSM